MNECTEQCSPEVTGAIVNANCQLSKTQRQHDVEWIRAIILNCAVQDVVAGEGEPGTEMSMSQHELLQAQLQDPVIARVLKLNKEDEKPDRKTVSQEPVKVK